jgi:hypothetical protein
MADLSDVSEALVVLAAQAMYPNGTDNPSATGGAVKAFAGWPLPAQLDADFHADPVGSQVSVWPRDEEKNTSRYNRDWQQQDPLPAPTVTATVTGQVVTIGGTGASGQNVAVLANGGSFVYAVQGSDTPTSIATALATSIAVAIPGTTSSGTVITLPASARLAAARVGVTSSLVRELRRQERRWQITVWAADPSMRDRIAATLDTALADLTFLTLPDGSAARIRYWGAHQVDNQQREGIYRRDLFYTVEYATTQIAAATEIVTEQINVGAQDINGNAVGTVTVNL